MQIISVVGARPNFMKIAPLCLAIEEHNQRKEAPIDHRLVHTGQHYDPAMSGLFFERLGIPAPDINLEVRSGSHAEQVGGTMIKFEKVLREVRPDWVVVVGDVNATLACAVTAKKEQVRVAHIEAGLRSFDMSMPEEINRIVTDRLSDLLFTTDEIAADNLRKEGVGEDRIKLVGNIMIDSLMKHREKSSCLDFKGILEANRHPDCGTSKPFPDEKSFSVVTLHRPFNVDDKEALSRIVGYFLDELSTQIPIIWPVHPRTRARLADYGLWEKLCASKQVVLLQPIGYDELLRLNLSARLMLTDSGGIQEECCVLGTPCLTLRWNTERPVTLFEHGGASILVGNDVDRIRGGFSRFFREQRFKPHAPPLWDGQTARRIVEIFASS